jgi:hypothetical protein
MARVALALVLLAALLGALYRLYGPPAAPSAGPAIAPFKRVVTDEGCSSHDTVVFELPSGAVGVPIEGKIGSHDACEGDDIEHMSGEIDWGDGTSSAVVPGDFLGKDKDALIVGKHTYAKSATYSLFVRLRAQCADRNGQSTRIISCASGTLQVR